MEPRVVVFGALGMSEESTHVYRLLVERPNACAADLSQVTGMPASVVGRVLSHLVREGLALRSTGRPPRYRAEAPDVAAAALIQRREQELHEARLEARQLAQTYREAVRLGNRDMAVELIGSPPEISSTVQRLTKKARSQLRAFDCPPYVDRPGSRFGEQKERQRRGVAHRVIYSEEAVAWPGRLSDDILPSVRAGEQARIRPTLPLKLLIVDTDAALLPLSVAPGGQQAAYLVRPSPLLIALEALFESQWARASALGSASGGDVPHGLTHGEQEPDAETRTLLELLASGVSDAAIARAVGWSERTTQRRMQRLMVRLEAATRFQAAVEASRRGWL